MKQLNISTPVLIAKYEEVPAVERQLIDEARRISAQAYAPFSNFSVGAAILLSSGKIVTGANQENVAYPSGTCAERVAAFYAHAHFPDDKFVTIAIAAFHSDGEELSQPISPCGNCRQALLEYENLFNSKIKVLLVGKEYIHIISSISDLLPLSFSHL